MTLDELLAELKADHNIDVPDLQARASEADKALALSNKIQAELVNGGVLKLSNGESASADELVGAVAEAGTKLVELSNTVDELKKNSEKKDAETRVDDLVKSGHILPKNRDAQVQLLLSNSELFDQLLPEKPIVKLSNVETTSELGTDDDSGDKSTAEEEIARLTASPAAKQYIRL